MSFNIRKSMHILYVPSFFRTITMPEANGELDSRMSPALNNSLIVSSAAFFFSVLRRLGASRKYLASGLSTMSCFRTLVSPMSVLFLIKTPSYLSSISLSRWNSFFVHSFRQSSIFGLVGKGVGAFSGNAIGNSESLAESKSDDGSCFWLTRITLIVLVGTDTWILSCSGSSGKPFSTTLTYTTLTGWIFILDVSTANRALASLSYRFISGSTSLASRSGPVRASFVFSSRMLVLLPVTTTSSLGRPMPASINFVALASPFVTTPSQEASSLFTRRLRGGWTLKSTAFIDSSGMFSVLFARAVNNGAVASSSIRRSNSYFLSGFRISSSLRGRSMSTSYIVMNSRPRIICSSASSSTTTAVKGKVCFPILIGTPSTRPYVVISWLLAVVYMFLSGISS